MLALSWPSPCTDSDRSGPCHPRVAQHHFSSLLMIFGFVVSSLLIRKMLLNTGASDLGAERRQDTLLQPEDWAVHDGGRR